MSYFWFKFFLNIALFECIIIVTSHPYNDNVNVTDSNDFSRYKRQVGSNVPTLVTLAAAAILCGRSSIERVEEIEESCKINVKTLDFRHALIVNPKDHSKFLYPDEKGDIYFAPKQEVFLSCSAEGNTFDQIADTENATFTCLCGDFFQLGTKAYRFNTLTCTEYPKSVIIDRGELDNVYVIDGDDIKDGNIYEVDERKIKHIYHRYDIGFFTDSAENFLNIITIIYRDDISTPWYARSVISGAIAGGQDTKARKPFDRAYCCNGKDVNIDSLYNVDTQDHTFEFLLEGHTAGSETSYIKKPNFVFNRGHLTPKSSMVYSAAAIATHAFLNAVPQWKIINSGNWDRTEEHVMNMAKYFKKDLTVYTGAYDTLRLKDTADGDKMKPIYLHATKERENIIREFPVPLYTYKLVVDLENRKGVVFVTVNNPYIEDPTQYHICKNPMTEKAGAKMPNWKIDKKTKKTTKKFDLTVGYSYMCTVEDFISKTGVLPVDLVEQSINDLLYIPDGSQVRPTPASVTTTTELKHDEFKKKRSF